MGRVDANGMVAAGQAGPTLVVCSTSNPAYSRLSEMFKNDSNGFVRFTNTISDAITVLTGGMQLVDGVGARILVAPGSYDETVTIPRTLQALTIQGLGGKGDAGIAPTTTAAKGMIIAADDVTLINLGVAGESTATAALISTGSRLRAIDCKFEGTDTSGSCVVLGPGTVAQVAAGTQGKSGDNELNNCTLCWSANGLELKASDYGAATQVLVKDCVFHNISGTCILGTPGAFGIGSTRNLEVVDCVFDRMEDGTKPSDFVNVNDAADTGIFTGNAFALATDAVADLKIGAGVFWVANATEAGITAARPA